MFDHITRAPRRSRQFYRSTAGSVAIHAGLIALLIWRAGDDISALLTGNTVPGEGFGTGPTAGPAGGGGGGESVAYIDIAPTPPVIEEEEIIEPEVEEIVPPEVPTLPEPLATPTPAPAESAPQPPASGAGTGAGEGTGVGTGPGADGGSGGGTGGGIGSGQGTGTGGGGGGTGNIRPPVPLSVILPPTPPASVRGRTVELRLSIDVRGTVREVEVVTPTGDRNYDNRLRRTAMDWRFQPARDQDNRAVAAEVPISFSF